ncbi:MAG TPA: radical SAM protein [Polyangiaceae bacterium]|nr:radical SAM protein [Polyangiaceae bacterium]
MTERPSLKSTLVQLTTDRHDRDAVGFSYVYPVVSRRAGGVSIGINLNTNNACNWRCIYCQVEGLTRGTAPSIDIARLKEELESLFEAIEHGQFLEHNVPPEYRKLSDIAISGNGEPTSSPQFSEVVELLGKLRQTQPLARSLPIVLITNGSLADRAVVQTALARLNEIGGQVWFKLDAGSDQGMRNTNSAATRLSRHVRRLEIVAKLCPTHVQSCWFRRAGRDPDEAEVQGFVNTLSELQAKGVPIRGVQLYTLARESHQPEAPLLGPVDPGWLESLGAKVAAIGFPAQVAR